MGRFKMEDYDYIDWIHQEFEQRVTACRSKGIDQHVSEIVAATETASN